MRGAILISIVAGLLAALCQTAAADCELVQTSLCCTGPASCVCIFDNDCDGDGIIDSQDTDDDNDGVPDVDEVNNAMWPSDPRNPYSCGNVDDDHEELNGVAGYQSASSDRACDDCSRGVDGFGPMIDANQNNDGPDWNGDGECDADTDLDGIADNGEVARGSDPNNPCECGSGEFVWDKRNQGGQEVWLLLALGDGCDDCAKDCIDGSPETYGAKPLDDGPDFDGDGLCDDGDTDDDNDGQPDITDPDPKNTALCGDVPVDENGIPHPDGTPDNDLCDDCATHAVTNPDCIPTVCAPDGSDAGNCSPCAFPLNDGVDDSPMDGACDINDADGDGVGCVPGASAGDDDCLDNCPDLANPDQEDIDQDGIGDACDTSLPKTDLYGCSVPVASFAAFWVLLAWFMLMRRRSIELHG